MGPENIKSLLLRVTKGHENAFREIFDIYSGKVYAYALKLIRDERMAEEIVQDIFLKIWLARRKLRFIDHFSSYLYTITRNHTFNILKRQALEARAKADLEREMASMHSETEDPRQLEYEHLLNQAINSLPPQQRLVYSMCHREGFRYEEVAEQLNISQVTVKTHMQRALRKIKSHLRGVSSALIPLIYLIF